MDEAEEQYGAYDVKGQVDNCCPLCVAVCTQRCQHCGDTGTDILSEYDID